jgi:uncharacterized membrane protein
MAATRPDLRVGDAERESTATALREHYAQGRLSTDELNERLDAAFSATTHGQLDRVTDDLPNIQPAPSAPPPPPAAVPRRPLGAGVARAVAALVTVVALLAVVTVALHGGAHVPRNIFTLVIALLILRGLVGRAFGHQHRHHQHPHQHWDSHAAVDSSDDDDRYDRASRRRHEHHHEHHRSQSGRGYHYSYRYEYDDQHPRDPR